MLDITRRLAVVAFLALPLKAMAAGYPPGTKVWSWTYNARGQKLTATAPDGATTTWTYHEDKTADHMVGDMESETTSDGRVTRFKRYNRLGQLLESVDPNGIVILQTWDLRQHLLSRNVGGRVTRYAYDAAGQLKRLTQPDGSWIGWDYDDAHRKVAVQYGGMNSFVPGDGQSWR